MTHQFALRPRFHELDPYNHVNHTAYLQYFEAARVEALEAVGHGLSVMKDSGFQIVLVELTAHFHTPATLGDDLVVETSVSEVTRASSTWRQVIRRGDETVATLDVRAAFTDLAGKVSRPPLGFAEAMRSI